MSSLYATSPKISNSFYNNFIEIIDALGFLVIFYLISFIKKYLMNPN